MSCTMSRRIPCRMRTAISQTRARRFVDDELIPWEVHAEEHEGLIPDDARAAASSLAVELGLGG